MSSESYRTLISVVVAARQANGFTQRQLAERLSKPPSFVAKIETGERRLDALEFIAVARALGLTPADLIAEADRALPADFEI